MSPLPLPPPLPPLPSVKFSHMAPDRTLYRSSKLTARPSSAANTAAAGLSACWCTSTFFLPNSSNQPIMSSVKASLGCDSQIRSCAATSSVYACLRKREKRSMRSNRGLHRKTLVWTAIQRYFNQSWLFNNNHTKSFSLWTSKVCFPPRLALRLYCAVIHLIGLLKHDGQSHQIPFINLTSLAKSRLWAFFFFFYQMDTRDKSKRSEETIHPSRQVR